VAGAAIQKVASPYETAFRLLVLYPVGIENFFPLNNVKHVIYSSSGTKYISLEYEKVVIGYVNTIYE